jgi:hypothetical protein
MTPAENFNLEAAVVMAVAETIRETSPTPAGVLYAGLMTHGCTFEQFASIIQALKNAKLVTESNHLLTWVGPFANKTA